MAALLPLWLVLEKLEIAGLEPVILHTGEHLTPERLPWLCRFLLCDFG